MRKPRSGVIRKTKLISTHLAFKFLRVVPQGKDKKNVLYKALFKKWQVILLFWAGLVILLLTHAKVAEAGIISDFFHFFTAGAASERSFSSTAAAVAMPLLGSQAAPALSGDADSKEEVSLPLPSVQESALVSFSNPAGTLPSSGGEDQIVLYKVEAGDTASHIAAKFGVSLNTLLWANNLRASGAIRPGDELIILPVTGVQYEVKKGDTINSIAKKLKSDPGEILSFNGLSIGESLDMGMILIVPDGEFAPPPGAGSSPSTAGRFANLKDLPGYFIRPVIGGRKSQGIHGYNGVDLASRCGLPVFSSAGGTVIVSRSSGWNGGYGKSVVISHPNNTQTLYAHMSSVVPEVGEEVGQWEQIGAIGSSGNSTGCHLHFEIRGARNPF